jgi:hypothetical protein
MGNVGPERRQSARAGEAYPKGRERATLDERFGSR